MTATDELKPCPFCGSEAKTHETIDGWIVSCNSEQSELDGFTHMAHGYGSTEAEAIAAWNRRADDAIDATLGRGTCRIKERHGDWFCTECGEMVGTVDTTSELYIDGNAIELWEYCPRCGAKVVQS